MKTNEQKMITRKQYMENSSELFNAYYAQFVTESTLSFVKSNVGMKLLKKSKDKHLNDIIQHSNGGAGGWIWDHSPINLELARQLGEVGERCTGSMATHTCIGKEAARQLLAAE
jgi:hypothetical protein